MTSDTSRHLEKDRDLLAGLGRKPSLQDGETVGGAEAGVGDPLLLLEGSAHVSVDTAVGRQAVKIFQAPILLNFSPALTGIPTAAIVEPAAGSKTVALEIEEVKELVVAPTSEGQAFRRMALSTLARLVRASDRTVTRFFDVDTADLDSIYEERRVNLSASQQMIPLEAPKVRNFLETTGLKLSGLGAIGLTARRIDAETPLMQVGTAGSEAYLLSEGRLRVSMVIPGVGEEALTFIEPGQMCGEMALIDDEPRSADVTAHQGAAEVYVLSRAVFQRLLHADGPEGAPLLAGITMNLCTRAEEALRRVIAFRVMAGPF